MSSTDDAANSANAKKYVFFRIHGVNGLRKVRLMCDYELKYLFSCLAPKDAKLEGTGYSVDDVTGFDFSWNGVVLDPKRTPKSYEMPVGEQNFVLIEATPIFHGGATSSVASNMSNSLPPPSRGNSVRREETPTRPPPPPPPKGRPGGPPSYTASNSEYEQVISPTASRTATPRASVPPVPPSRTAPQFVAAVQQTMVQQGVTNAFIATATSGMNSQGNPQPSPVADSRNNTSNNNNPAATTIGTHAQSNVNVLRERELQERVSKLEVENERLSNKLISVTRARDELESVLAAKERELVMLRDAHKGSEAKTQGQLWEKLIAAQQEAGENLRALRRKEAEHETIVTQLTQEKAMLEMRVQSVQAQTQVAVDERESAKRLLQNSEQELAMARKEIDDLLRRLRDTEREREKDVFHARSVHSTIEADTEQHRSKLLQVVRENENLSTEIAKLRNENAQLIMQLNDSSKEKLSLKKQGRDLEEECESLRQRCSDNARRLEKQLEITRRETESLEATRDELLRLKAAEATATAERGNLNERLVETETERQRLQRARQELISERDKLNAALKEAQDEITKLANSVNAGEDERLRMGRHLRETISEKERAVQTQKDLEAELSKVRSDLLILSEEKNRHFAVAGEANHHVQRLTQQHREASSELEKLKLDYNALKGEYMALDRKLQMEEQQHARTSQVLVEVEGAKDRLKEQLTAATVENQRLQEVGKQQEAVLTASKEESAQLSAKLEKSISEMNKLQDQIAELADRKNGLSKGIADAEEKLEDKERITSTLQRKLDQLQAASTKEKEDAEAAIETERKGAEASRQRARKLEHTVSELEGQLHTTEELLKNSKRELWETQLRFGESEDAVQQAKNTISTLEHQITALKDENALLIARSDKANSMLQRERQGAESHLEQLMHDHEAVLSKWNAKLDEERSERLKITEDFKGVEAQLKSSKRELSRAEDDLQTARGEASTLRQKLHYAEEAQRKAERDLENARQTLKREQTAFAAEKDAMELELDTLKSQTRRLALDSNDKGGLVIQSEGMRKELRDLRIRASGKEDATREAEALRSQIKQLHENLSLSSAKEEELLNQLRNLKAVERDRDALGEQLRSLQQNLQRGSGGVTTSAMELEAIVMALKKQNEALRLDYDAAASARDELRVQVNQLRHSKEILVTERDDLNHRVRRLQEENMVIRRPDSPTTVQTARSPATDGGATGLRSTIQSLEEHVSFLREQNQQLTEQLARGGGVDGSRRLLDERRALQSQVDKLTRENEALQIKLDVESEKLKDALSALARFGGSRGPASDVPTIDEAKLDIVLRERDTLRAKLEHAHQRGSEETRNLAQQMKSITEERRRLMTENDDLRAKFSQLSFENSQLRGQLGRATDAASPTREFDMAMLQERVQSLERDVIAKQHSIDIMAVELNDATDALKKSQAALLEERRQRMDDDQQRTRESSDVRAQLSGQQIKHAAALAELKDQIHDLKEERHKLQETLQRRERELNTLRIERAHDSAVNGEDLNMERLAWDNERRSWEAERREMEKALIECNEMLAQLQKDNKRLVRKLHTAADDHEVGAGTSQHSGRIPPPPAPPGGGGAHLPAVPYGNGSGTPTTTVAPPGYYNHMMTPPTGAPVYQPQSLQHQHRPITPARQGDGLYGRSNSRPLVADAEYPPAHSGQLIYNRSHSTGSSVANVGYNTGRARLPSEYSTFSGASSFGSSAYLAPIY